MKKKICFIVSTPLTAKAFLLNHFEALSNDFEVSLIANFEKENINDFKLESLKHIHSIAIHRSINIFQDILAVWNLTWYLKKMQFDAVHTVTPKAALIGMLSAKLAGVNNRIHIFTGQVWHTKTGFFKRVLMFIDRLIVKLATVVLVDGKSQRQFLIDNHIVSPKNSFVLGEGSISGVNTSKFSPNKDIKIQMRKQLGFGDNDVVFMFLGRFNIDKGLLDLAKAFEKLSVSNKNSKLLLVGFDEENMEPKIKNIIKNEEIVLFTGPTSRPQDYLQAADVFCLPSYREGFGTSVIEASLMELPIICSDTYGLMETIIDNKTGLRHKVANVESLYEQMEILYLDESKRIAFGENGAKYVKDNFSAQKISNEWLCFYRKMLN